jgi:predicted acetyltransferase
MRVQLDEAAADSRGVLAELLDEYLRELAGHREIAVGAVGAAGYPHLDAYFVEPGRHAFLIRHGGEIAGFAMVRTPASTGSPASQMAEFYVRHEQRGRGVGRAAVAAIWRRFPGAWELQVHARNAAAVRFWEACIRSVVRRPPEKRVIEAADGRRFQLEFHVGERQPPPVRARLAGGGAPPRLRVGSGWR